MTRDLAEPDPLTEPVPSAPAKSRLLLVDKLRGLVIVLMILDHTRHFFHADAFAFSPTDLDKTNALLFATRWITHLCAPTFVFLAGVSVRLQRERGKRGWDLSRFLLTRGLWLILLEATIVSFGFSFKEPYLLLQVIYAIGASFVLLSALVRGPPAVVFILGLAIIVGHDLLTQVAPPAHERWRLAWTLLVRPDALHVLPGFVAYPALPWFGIMAAGYGAGAVFLAAPERRNRTLVAAGLVMLAAFFVLRAIDAYGDPRPWVAGHDTTHNVLAFFNVTKYPPSLMYVLATLGAALLVTPALEHVRGPAGRLLRVFGRTPLFTYLVHLYVVHGLALIAGAAMGLSPRLLAGSTGLAEAGWGFGLAVVYAVWIGVVLMLWPLSAWFGGLKDRRRTWWLSYV